MKNNNTMKFNGVKINGLILSQEVIAMKIRANESFKSIRILNGYSIQGLAKAMHVNASVVFNIEKANI